MAYKFFNIGKANAEIERLEQELAAAKAAKPDATISAQLAEALASNETISGQLTAATAESAALKAQVSELTGKVTKLEADAAKHAVDMENLEKSVNDRAAKRAQEIQARLGSPAAPAVDPAAKTAAAGQTGMARLLAAAKSDLQRAGYVPKTQ